MRRRCLPVALILVAGICTGEEHSGADVCRPCHPSQYSTQIKSHHASALRPINDTPLPALLAGSPIRERNGIEYSYEPDASALRVVVRKGSADIRALLLWAFGSGAQAYTLVGLHKDRYFEHRVSFYTAAGRPGRTLGHSGEASRTPEAALGIIQENATIYRCFDCHATGVKPGPDLRNMKPGITCERCHGSGAEHVAQMKSGQSASGLMIRKLSSLPPRESVAVCAECHRFPSANPKAEPEVDDPLSIRFQPIGLLQSKCFLRSGKLDCTTCHDPHADASNREQFYVDRCIGCHASTTVQAQCGLPRRENCLPCHMQKRSPAEFLTFTDHRIRIYR